MRTTLEIEDDVLQAAKELAKLEGRTAGQVISSLARKGLSTGPSKTTNRAKYKNGVPIIASRGEVITMEHVLDLLEQEDPE